MCGQGCRVKSPRHFPERGPIKRKNESEPSSVIFGDSSYRCNFKDSYLYNFQGPPRKYSDVPMDHAVAARITVSLMSRKTLKNFGTL